MKFWPAPCSEFPNDNPQLHDGALWLCSWTRARPRAVMPAESAARSAATAPATIASPAPDELRVAEEDVAVGQLPHGEPPVDATIPCGPPSELDLASPLQPQRLSLEQLQPRRAGGEVIARQPVTPAAPATAAPLLPPMPHGELLAAHQAEAPPTATTTIVAEYPPDDPFVAELQALVDPLGSRRPSSAPTRPTTLRVPRPDDLLVGGPDDDWDTFVEELTDETATHFSEMLAEGDEDWPSALSLRAVTEVQERELAALEREVAELQALYDVESYPEPAPSIATTRAQTGAPVSATVLRDNSADLGEASDGPGFEPLSLEAFLSGEVLVEQAAPPAAQGLDPLELDLGPLPDTDRAWQELVGAVCRFLLDQNATRAAALVPGLLEGRALNLSRLSEPACEALRAATIAEEKGRDLVVTREFRERCGRLREAFSARRLDVETLTRWLAGIVVALLGTPEQEVQVLSQLRASSVATAIERAA